MEWTIWLFNSSSVSFSNEQIKNIKFIFQPLLNRHSTRSSIPIYKKYNLNNPVKGL